MQHILIIGAGASGLMAGRILSSKGHVVTFLEARDRIGGRIHTQHTGRFAKPIECGAEFIHGHLETTINLLKEKHNFTVPIFLETVLDLWLVNGKENSQNIMFREIWALSSRNKELEIAVETYYKNYCIWTVELFASFFKQPERLISLLIPYAEGYAIMGTVLPLDKKKIIGMLMDLIEHMES